MYNYEENPEVIFGYLTKRVDFHRFIMKVHFSTSEEFKGNYKEVLLVPTTITVNTICYNAFKVGLQFVDTMLIGGKAMFIIRGVENEKLWGELYRLPLGLGNALKIPAKAEQMFETFTNPEYSVVLES